MTLSLSFKQNIGLHYCKYYNGAAVTILLLSFFFCGTILSGCNTVSNDTGTAEKLELIIAGDQASFAPGVTVELAVKGISIPTTGEIHLNAAIGNNEVLILPVKQDTLAFFVPALVPGNHTIEVNLDDYKAEVAFTVVNYDRIENPTEYVDDIITDISTSLGTIIEEESEPAIRNYFKAQLAELENTMEEWLVLPADQKETVAHIIHSMLQNNTPRMTASKVHMVTGEECVAAAGFKADLVRLAWSGGVFALSLKGGTMSLTTAQPWFAVAFGVTGAISGAVFFQDAKKLIDNHSEVLECVFAQAVSITDLNSSNKMYVTASNDQVNFTHGLPKKFAAETGFALQEVVLDLFSEAYKIIHEFAAIVPDSWLSVFNVSDDLIWQQGAPEDLSISHISPDNITGSLTVINDEIEMTYSFADESNQPEEAQDFEITLSFGGQYEKLMAASLEPREFALTGRWYMIVYGVYNANGEFNEGAISYTEVFDFGNGGNGRSVGYNDPELDNVCHVTEGIELAQNYLAAESHVLLEVGNYYQYYKYDPLNPNRLEAVKGAGNFDAYHSALQKNNPGSPC